MFNFYVYFCQNSQFMWIAYICQSVKVEFNMSITQLHVWITFLRLRIQELQTCKNCLVFCPSQYISDVVFNADQRSSPFGLSNYDDIANERSVTGSTGGLSHAFNLAGPPGPPSVLSAGPPSGMTASGAASVSWKPVAVTQPASCVSISRGEQSALDVGRLTANMQVSTVTTTIDNWEIFYWNLPHNSQTQDGLNAAAWKSVICYFMKMSVYVLLDFYDWICLSSNKRLMYGIYYVCNVCVWLMALSKRLHREGSAFSFQTSCNACNVHLTHWFSFLVCYTVLDDYALNCLLLSWSFVSFVPILNCI